MRTTATKRFEIDAGHRLLLHEGKCHNLHGHRYAFEVEVEGDVHLDGMVLDFGLLKQSLGGWLDANWDHALLLEIGDPLAKAVKRCDPELRVVLLPKAPSAENLARLLLHEAVVAVMRISKEARVVRVRCWETPTCYAEVRP